MTNAPDIAEDGLTEADIHLIDHVANGMIAAGVWVRVTYCPSETVEFFEAYAADISEPVCGMGRHRGGLYVIADYSAGVVMVGSTLIGALQRHAKIDPTYAPLLPN